MKIIAMLPVKNEAWVLRHCLQSLSFCDEILAIDDNSNDATRAILEEFKCTIIPFDTSVQTGWKEYGIRDFLLREARTRMATHLVAIDGDEMFSDAFVRDARALIETLEKGQSLALPWVNVIDTTHAYAPVAQKIFVMRDDGVSVFREQFLHVPRVPTYRRGIDLHPPYAVLHFQYVNTIRNTYKQIWYMMSECIKGNRSPLRINTMYDVRMKKIAYPVSLLTQLSLPDPTLDQSMWQKERVLQLFEQYGVGFFEPLDIWHESALREQFIATTGRLPKPVVAPEWLLTVNAWKNKLKNLYHAHFS